MTVMPDALVQSRAPTSFSVTQLALAEECLLKGVLASARAQPSLGLHPVAVLGSVFHRLLEKSVRGEIQRAGNVREDIERVLSAMLDEEDGRLAQAWPDEDPPRLSAVHPPLTWRKKRRMVLDAAEKYLTAAVPRISTARSPTYSAHTLPAVGRWAEFMLDAPSLRLHGKVDLLERASDVIVIRDLKSGRVVGHDGVMLPRIERQMRLYGAIAATLWPASRIRLIVDHGAEFEVAFDKVHETEVQEWLQQKLNRLPAESVFETTKIATPGVACDGCSCRHLCPAYREVAVECWRGDSPARMPLDTWGEVRSVAQRSGGRTDLTIRDAAGRMVKVFGLASFRVSTVRVGEKVWIFGLRTEEKRGGPGVWHQPRNFFEISDDDPFGRAWAVAVFCESVPDEPR